LKQDYDSNTDNNQENYYYGLVAYPSGLLDFFFHLSKLLIFLVSPVIELLSGKFKTREHASIWKRFFFLPVVGKG